MGWNFPSGNEDIVYFVYTFYNVTSLDPLAYSSSRASMQAILLEQALSFHALNNAAFAVTLPVGGSVTYSATCDIDPAATGTLDNTASVSSAVNDPVSGNDSATDSKITVSSSPVLANGEIR